MTNLLTTDIFFGKAADGIVAGQLIVSGVKLTGTQLIYDLKIEFSITKEFLNLRKPKCSIGIDVLPKMYGLTLENVTIPQQTGQIIPHYAHISFKFPILDYSKDMTGEMSFKSLYTVNEDANPARDVIDLKGMSAHLSELQS
ncbi:MAG: hypothetical protein MHMPM18_000301 [Marteilia pararefringens]